jgi:eukaryotic-like serine/threonine-protein kinase
MKVTAVSAAADSAGRYVIDGTLGRGGMAKVYLGTDRELERPVAVKVLAPELAADESARKRFVREARLAAKIVHPNVAQVYDVGEGPLGPFIVAEYVDGRSLADEVQRRGHLPPDEVVAVGIQVCAGLAAAHAEGIVHRDVKPANILLDGDGRVKIVDFGIARSLAATTQHTELGTVLGTAAYLAREQAQGGPVTPAVDVYALGVVLYELLAGRTPFASATPEELLSIADRPAPTPVRDLAPDVPPSLELVVMGCLARLPEFRPSAAELAVDLQASTDETRTLPLTMVALARGGRRRRRNLLVGLAAAALVIGGAVGVAAVPGGKQPGGDGATPPSTRAPVTRRTPTTAQTQRPVSTVQTRRQAGARTPKQAAVHSRAVRRGHGKDHDKEPRGKAEGHARD